MIFQKVLSRMIYKDSRGEKNSRKVSCMYKIMRSAVLYLENHDTNT